MEPFIGNHLYGVKREDVRVVRPDEGDGDLRERRPAPKVELRDVSQRFGGTQALAPTDLSITVRPGEFVSIVGPSGCGKTTLFNVVSGILQAHGPARSCSTAST